MQYLLVFIQDLEGLCNLAAFDLAEDSPSPERHQFRLEGSTLQELSKGSKGELIPISPGGITPPSILSHRSRRRIALSPDTNSSMTPKSTPVKALPFSPSQVGSVLLYMVEAVMVEEEEAVGNRNFDLKAKILLLKFYFFNLYIWMIFFLMFCFN